LRDLARVSPYPKGFHARQIGTNRTLVFVRVGGRGGPAVVLVHGLGDTGDMGEPIAWRLVKDRAVVPAWDRR